MGDELLTLLVLTHLGLEPQQLTDRLVEALRFLPTLVEHPREASGARHPLTSGTVHGDVAVPFEQAHQPADRIECDALLGVGKERDDATVFERIATGPHLGGGPLDRFEEPLRVGIGGGQRRLDQGQIMLPHPRHAGELGPVGDLMEGQPEAELAGWEGKALLEGQHVGTDVVHDVLVFRTLIG